MLRYLRHHWFDLGLVFGILILISLLFAEINIYGLQFLLWVNLVTLFFHQFEEYRFPGYFPGMINSVMYHSKRPDRFPLNTNTSLIVNVFVGWGIYILAAIFGDKALWLSIGAIIVSLGNLIAHTFVFNIKGKTLYNPGQLTAIFLFLPVICYFFYFLSHNNIGTTWDYVIGIVLGILLNIIGILKAIDWLKDENTLYIFEKRQLRPVDRQT